MNEVLPSLGGVALFAAAGLGLAELLPAVRAIPLLRRLGYAYLLGIAAVSGTLWALSHLLGVPLRPPAIWATAAVPALAGLAARVFQGAPHPPGHPLPSPPTRRREGGRRKRRKRGLALAGVAVMAVVGLVCLGLLAEAVTNPVANWDGRMTWAAQARYIRAEGTVDAVVLRRPQWYINHPRYPLLLPVTQVAVLEAFAAEEGRDIFRATYAALFPAFLLVLLDGARLWAGRVPAALACLAAAGVPALNFWGDGGASSGYSDQPLACFFGAGLVLLLRSRRSLSGGLAAGLLLAGAALAKNEGTFLAVFALLIAGAAELRRMRRPPRRRRTPHPPGPPLPSPSSRPGKGGTSTDRLPGPSAKVSPLPGVVRVMGEGPGVRGSARRRVARLALATIPVALAMLLFASWRSGIPDRYDELYTSFVDPGDFWPEVVTRIPLMAPVLARETSSWEIWHGFWWMAPLVLATGWRGWRGRQRAVSLPLLLGLASPIAVVWGAYTVHWDPVYLAPVTWNRFLVQTSLPLFLLLALSLRDLLRRAAVPAGSPRLSSRQRRREILPPHPE